MHRPNIQPVVTRTMRINYAGGLGTAFLYRHDRGTAFLTASHNLKGAQAGDNVLFQMENSWSAQTITSISRDKGYDACAFSTDKFVISEDIARQPDLKIFLGDEVLFLGFPHDLMNTYPGAGLATPLVRSAVFSGIIHQGDLHLAILDSFNNPGYSGSPVYAYAEEGGYTLFGLISGYRTERPAHGRIIRQNPDGTEEVLPDLYAHVNSGMTQAIPRGRLDLLIDSLDVYLAVGAENPVS